MTAAIDAFVAATLLVLFPGIAVSGAGNTHTLDAMPVAAQQVFATSFADRIARFAVPFNAQSIADLGTRPTVGPVACVPFWIDAAAVVSTCQDSSAL